jgi:L-ascorbate metabolism protein UlaG (beta-lactamase superfamily)
MKLKLALAFLFASTIMIAEAQLPQPDDEKVKGGELTIQPITHATLILTYQKKNIYTMDVNQAAQGVLAFKPKIVYPYHYRGQDVNTFKTLVNSGDKNIEVRLRNWYPAAK